MANKTNLDAFIPREDFEVVGDIATNSKLPSYFKIRELEPESLTFLTLRKPDFQRETNSWEPQKVADFINSFLEGDLIPTVILWRSDKSGNVFVIDGAHRLSALIAWAHDDYGDKTLSRKFFDNYISKAQINAAEITRKLIEAGPGSYAQMNLALAHPETTTPERIRLAKNLSAFGIELQWVAGDAKKAEKSFFVINQQGEPINQTELQMIKDRRKPNALAARALIRAGTGHKYWSEFAEDIKKQIESTAREIHQILFASDLETPIKTLDLPVAGRSYSSDSVKLIFDFVAFANRSKFRKQDVIKSLPRSRSNDPHDEGRDESGYETLEYLRSVKKLISLITGNSPASLGLHPAVYYYSATGRYQPASFLATITMVKELEAKKQLNTFTRYRSQFEEFILNYKYFINQIVQIRGSGERGMTQITSFYRCVFSGCVKGLDEIAILAELKTDSQLKSLIREVTDEDIKCGRNFSSDTKSSIFLREANAAALRCSICDARVHKNAISIDHSVRKQDGGIGSPENGEVTHPYCNSGYKESLHSEMVQLHHTADEHLDFAE